MRDEYDDDYERRDDYFSESEINEGPLDADTPTGDGSRGAERGSEYEDDAATQDTSKGNGPRGQVDAPTSTIPPAPTPHLNGHANGAQAGRNGYVLTHPNDLRSNLKQWQMQLAGVAYRILRNDPEYANKASPAQTFLEPLIADLRNAVEALKGTAGSLPPADLTESDLHEECEREARLALEDWLGVQIWSKPKPSVETPKAQSLIVCQDQEQAAVNNAAYLARPEIIERLGFAQSIGLMIGGKHHGKTTNVRTLALSVMRGLPIWERRTTQGAVIYAASDDEMASTRNELLRMGWTAKRDPLTLVSIAPKVEAKPEAILEAIGELALKQRAILIILDMLFDFVGVKDELGYADTRSAMAPVMQLADMTKAFVVGSHHTPKYLTDAHNAANAALGSQGIAARFSPIIFTRKWTDGLFTVESTMTRDPRGEALKPMRIVKNGVGWIETAGEFKEWMKWELYAERVMAVFEGGQPNAGHTVYSIADELQIDRARIQNTLVQLVQRDRLAREKHGRSYRYYLRSAGMFERENGAFNGAMQKTTKETVAVHPKTGVHTNSSPRERKLWGDEDQELDENGIPKGW